MGWDMMIGGGSFMCVVQTGLGAHGRTTRRRANVALKKRKSAQHCLCDFGGRDDIWIMASSGGQAAFSF